MKFNIDNAKIELLNKGIYLFDELFNDENVVNFYKKVTAARKFGAEIF